MDNELHNYRWTMPKQTKENITDEFIFIKEKSPENILKAASVSPLSMLTTHRRQSLTAVIFFYFQIAVYCKFKIRISKSNSPFFIMEKQDGTRAAQFPQ